MREYRLRLDIMGSRQKDIIYYKNDNGCWICISHYRDKDGYNKIYDGSNQRPMHRLVWEHYNKSKIPDGMVILHSCDCPSCINHEHLSIGTALDNNHDKIAKNRQSKGCDVGGSKLSEEQVKKIYYDEKTSRVLADIYHVSIPTIHDIKNKRSWLKVTKYF